MFAQRPIIGLAGGIGAGKSHVAKLFEQAGCCRVDSDEMVHAAYTHPDVKRQVLARFGDGVLDPTGRIDRKKLGPIVFADFEARRWLEELLHPVANAARVEVMSQAATDGKVSAYVWDSPLLFETRLDELCDVKVFVDAPRADRLARVEERGWDEAELTRRERAQMPPEEKRERCDFTLMNGGTDATTAEEVADLLRRIVANSQPASGGCCGGRCSGGGGCCGGGGGGGGGCGSASRCETAGGVGTNG
jgi:dephospho-CoA kinase